MDLAEPYQPVAKEIDVFYLLRNTTTRDGYWRKIRIYGYRVHRGHLSFLCYDKRRKTTIRIDKRGSTYKIKGKYITKIQAVCAFDPVDII